MSIKKYLKDKWLFISINTLLFIPLAMFISYIGVQFVWVSGLFIIWFLPMTVFFTIDYLKKADFYNSLVDSLNCLDKQYLISETTDCPEFLEGEIVYKVLKSIEDNIYNHIKYYEDKEKDYREYIETWIHEIKTPIASARLIINNNKNEATKNIETEVSKIEDFLEQVLYYSRSNDTSKDYIVKELNLGMPIKNVLKRNARDFIYKDIELSLENIDNIVYTDIKWIEFILNQIISNAIKYSRKENAKIKIYSYKNDNSVVLVLEDNGIGIPKHDVRRVFDKGFTGENGRIYGKSTGMGLYICHELVIKLGLGIELISEQDKGTKVKINFPLGKITMLES